MLAELRKCGLTDTENCLKTVTLSLNGGDTVRIDPGSPEPSGLGEAEVERPAEGRWIRKERSQLPQVRGAQGSYVPGGHLQACAPLPSLSLWGDPRPVSSSVSGRVDPVSTD